MPHWIIETLSALMDFLTDVLVPLGWQIVVVVFFLFFRNEIGSAISRLKRFGSTGAELEPIQDLPNTPDLGATSRALETQLNHHTDPTLKPFFDRFKERLSAVPYANETEVLIDLLVTENRRAYCETLLRHIFGSQLSFIFELEQVGRSDAELVRRHYRSHVQRSAGNEFRTETEWLSYLLRAGFIVGAHPEYQLTDTGKSGIVYFRQTAIDATRFPS